jgi:hypothetical protein
LTLADVYLISALVEPFKQFFDKKTRMAKFNNLTRYMSLNLESFHFLNTYGTVVMCKKTVTPPPPQKKPEEAKGAKPADGKDQAKEKKGGDQKAKGDQKPKAEKKEKQAPPKEPEKK